MNSNFKSDIVLKSSNSKLSPQLTFFFIDWDGAEACSNSEPFKKNMDDIWQVANDCAVELPKGTIKSLFGIDLSPLDNPIMVYI